MPLTTTPPALYFEDRGAGDPLLVITVFAVSAAVLEPLVDLYATRLRCITYDHPGRVGRRSGRCRSRRLTSRRAPHASWTSWGSKPRMSPGCRWAESSRRSSRSVIHTAFAG